MNKTCVFITGTNAVGKTSLAKELIIRFGGIESSDKKITLCKDGRTCFAGHYDLNTKYGGIDAFNQTKCLKDVVMDGLNQRAVIICEGMYLHTFGINLTNAMFVADRHLVVFLYCPVSVINDRLIKRAGKGVKNDAVWKKQINCAASLRKWKSIGVNTISVDTSLISIDNIACQVIDIIDRLCTK